MGRVARRVAAAVIGAAGLVLLVAATRAESTALQAQPSQVALVPLVGVAFLLAGAFAQTSALSRVLVAGVGVAWLAGSLSPGLLVAHQGLLVVATLSLTGFRPRWATAILSVLAVPVALGLLTQPAVAAVFALSALSVPTRSGRVDSRQGTQRLVGGLLATTLVLAWSLSRTAFYDPLVGLVAYEAVLIVVALVIVLSSRVSEARQRAMADRMVGDERSSGLAGLAQVLREVLRDPTVRLGAPGSGGIPVLDGRREVATIGGGRGLRDPVTLTAVRRAVLLVARGEERREESRRALAELDAARLRVAAAIDRQRAESAAQLGGVIAEPLSRLGASLTALELDRGSEAAQAVTLARLELDAAAAGVRACIVGTPPVRLGEGRLGPALIALARGCAVPTTAEISPAARANAQVESALFYACAEALVNVQKHARAADARVRLTADDGLICLDVLDDGVGGARVDGSGLRGLVDRLEAVGGALRVVSPPGAGTRVTATVPTARPRSASTARRTDTEHPARGRPRT